MEIEDIDIKFNEIDLAKNIVNLFLMFNDEDGCYEYPEEILEKFKNSLDVIEKYLNEGLVDPKDEYGRRRVFNKGKKLYDMSEPMILHKFGE